MPPSAHLERLAREMRAAQDLGQQIEPLSARAAGFDHAAAYEVGQLIHQARVREGATPVGRKIGFTNRSVWRSFGIAEPIWAFVYDTTVVHMAGGTGRCAIGRFAEPRVEPEIVLHFHSAPPDGAGPAELLQCVDWIAQGFEIVQSHFPGWKFQATDAIADAGLHGALLVGEPQPVDRLGPDLLSRLERFTISLSCDGQVRDTGRGANVLGSPLAAATHLLTLLKSQPLAASVQAGELVTTGTLTGALPIQPGETWSTALDGIALPGLSVTFDR